MQFDISHVTRAGSVFNAVDLPHASLAPCGTEAAHALSGAFKT